MIIAANATEPPDPNDPDTHLRRLLSIIGFGIGLEAIAVNIFALWFFFKIPSAKNVHGRLCITKTASDLPFAVAMTFWWLPWSYFYKKSDSFPGLHGPNLSLDFIIVTITFTSYYFALNVEVLIVLARFTAVFYTFTFKMIFRQKFMSPILFFCLALGFIPVAFSSFTNYCVMYYTPLWLAWDILDITDFPQPCKYISSAYVVTYSYICTLAVFCIIIAMVTVWKLHVLNNSKFAQNSMSSMQRARRRHSEWVLLVVSLTSPFVISLRGSVSLIAFFTKPWSPFNSMISENFVYNFILDFVVVQANAIIQLCINPTFWAFLRGNPLSTLTNATKMTPMQKQKINDV
uniref:7TM_GPCR_Srx domain-containing protein n=1 Tax=Bursaphelenchus xylophilus TaxID=6326 RepID=A0A1I7RZ71_BURXY